MKKPEYTIEDTNEAEQLIHTISSNIEVETANYDMLLFGQDLVEFEPNQSRLTEQPLGRFYANEFIDLNRFKKVNLSFFLRDRTTQDRKLLVYNNCIYFFYIFQRTK